MIRANLAAGLALVLASCAASAAPHHPEGRPYAAKVDAAAAVDTALARASTSGKRVLLVMGANWCHDSRALAGWLETPRFAALVAERFELVFVDVGSPQSGTGRNLAIAQRFGLESVSGTPSLLVLSSGGELLNPDTASRWRNAASRSEEAIYAELAALAGAGAEAP